MRTRIVAVVGATATGKSALGEALAARLGGEVVCADSRQVYRALELGTGKPSPEERAVRPHHLFDALGLGDHASAGWYRAAARAACADIQARGGTPILVGGSGLYLQAAHRGLAASPPRAPEVRERLRLESTTLGIEALHQRLAELDPTTASRLAPHDAQRIVRALEVYEVSGRRLSWWHGERHAPGIEGVWKVIEIVVSGPKLWDRITERTRRMFEAGLIAETAALVAAGQAPLLRALRAVGYEEVLDLLAGTASRSEAERRTNLRTRQLAKRQRTWFRHQVDAVRLEGDDLGTDALARIAIAEIETRRAPPPAARVRAPSDRGSTVH